MLGALVCNSANSAMYSSGRTSGTVDKICATFINGPLRPPRAIFSSAACSGRSSSIPNSRLPAKRAAMPPMAEPTRA